MFNLLEEVLTGILIGFLSGMFGLGGSSIATPLLRTIIGVKPTFALATPLPVVIPSAVSASLVYHKRGLINFNVAKVTIIFGFPFVLIGAILTRLVSGKFLMLSTAVFVFTVGLSFLFRKDVFKTEAEGKVNKFVLISLSGLIGLISGFLANGGGVMLVPFYVKALKMDIKSAFATSLFVIPFFAIPGTVVHFLLGHIDLKLLLVLVLTSIPFANFGAKLAVRLKNETLEIAYGIFLVVFSIFFFVREV